MQVYVELAALENFCMDFVLLYGAKAASKNAGGYGRIALGSLLGAGFAVAFPLFGLGAGWSVAVKILSALVICLVSGKFKSVKSYIKFCGAFLLFSAVLGGALIGIFTLAGWDYSAGEGYLISSIPVGIPLFGALIILIGIKKLAQKLSKGQKNAVTCKVYRGENCVEVKGFFDSGNKVYIRGEPVSVIPKEVAEKFSDLRIKDEVKIHTVAGSKKIGVFTADKLEIDFGENTRTFLKVKVGISPQKIDRAVLHCDLLEE